MGMSTRIGRRVTITDCDCLIVDKDNNSQETSIQLYGDYSDVVRAQNAARKALNNKRILVRSIAQKAYYCSMPIEKFFENADKIVEVNLNKEED